MKFYLLKNQVTKFAVDEKSTPVTRVAKITPTVPILNEGGSEFERNFSKTLEEYAKNGSMFVFFCMRTDALEKNQLRLKIKDANWLSLLYKLYRDTYKECIRLKLKCKNLHGRSDKEFANVSFRDLKIELNSFDYCCKAQTTVPSSFFNLWNSSMVFTGTLSVSVHVSNECLAAFYSAPRTDEIASTCQKILNDGVSTDVVLVSGDGTTFNCHSNFLAAHSPIFHSMFRNDVPESQRKLKGCKYIETVRLTEMTDPSVMAFLSYIYHCDITEANKNCAITFELLWMAHKYEITSLEEKMCHILKWQFDSWYTVDIALRLFLYAKEKKALNGPSKTALRALKSKSSNEIRKSPVFQKLFKDDPEAAMDLFIFCIKA